jgi:omega-6 fatty acid desaturase (delta-12 desaturase)
MTSTENHELTTHWRKAIAPYQRSDMRISLGQLASSLLPYFALLGLMVWSLKFSYWLTLLLAIPAAGFLVRIFIIFHDCGHGSFFKLTRHNTIAGYITGILTFTPYERWRRDHAIHHATAGNLDRRGVGDVPTWTVEEFQAAPRWKRLLYRFIRNPFVLFLLSPIPLFVISFRFISPKAGKREKLSVIYTDLALLGILLLAHFTIGLKAYLMVQLPVIWLAGAIGEWMFYVQHQYPRVYWVRQEEWDYLSAGIRGASYYKLPRVLQWFTGSIGFHHIHHLAPRIPNYNLEKCHTYNPIFHSAYTLTPRASLRCVFLNLWDEKKQQLVAFSSLKSLSKSNSTET